MSLLFYLVSLYETILIIRVVLSWAKPDPRNRIVHWIYRLTDPVLNPIRRILPTQNFGFDFSPIIVFFILEFIKRAL